jgi:Raf kinase inhibitor-like YbhB/YbcL family protein
MQRFQILLQVSNHESVLYGSAQWEVFSHTLRSPEGEGGRECIAAGGVDVPPGTQSFVLTIFDRHPIAHNWLHWCIINLPASMRELAEGASGVRERISEGSLEIRNSYGDAGYGGPNPPRHSGPHNYEITVYALSTPSLPLGPLASSEECLDAIKRHILARASVVGVFEQ